MSRNTLVPKRQLGSQNGEALASRDSGSWPGFATPAETFENLSDLQNVSDDRGSKPRHAQRSSSFAR